MTKNIINNKKYIGQDSNNNPEYLGSGFLLKKAISKYGKESFEKIILEKCNSKEELDCLEKFWINKYNAVKNDEFYNIASGGDGGNLGPLVNEKRKRSLIGHSVSKKTRYKISKAHIGKTLSEETKNRMSKSHSGKQKTSSHILKVAKSNTGLKRTNEAKEKMSLAWKRKEKIKCPHCNIESINMANMTRYHLDKCKKSKWKN